MEVHPERDIPYEQPHIVDEAKKIEHTNSLAALLLTFLGKERMEKEPEMD